MEAEQPVCAAHRNLVSSALPHVLLLQEAQHDTIMSFERYMNDSMTRDWATDKQGLFSSIAPYTGLGGPSAAGLSFGSVARADVSKCRHRWYTSTKGGLQ